MLGFLLAVALHFSTTLRRGVYPLLVASQAVPIVIIAPLLVVWFGFGIVPKLGIIALVCFFPVVVTTLDALRSVDPDQLKLMRTLDATRWQAFRWAEAPAALPAALSGAKIAVAVAVIGAVFAEYAGSSEGLGHLMLQAIPQLETARAYAAVVLLAAFAVALFCALRWPSAALVPWARRRPEGPDRDPPPAARRLLAARSPPAARRLRRAQGAHRRAGRSSACADARLLPQRRPRGDLRGARPTATSAAPGSTSRSRRRAIPPRRSSCCRPARSTSPSPTSPSCCSRATRALKLVAVGALVQKPLTSIMSIGKHAIDDPAAAEGQDGRHRGHPLPVGLSEGDPRSAPASTRRRSRRSTSASTSSRR